MKHLHHNADYILTGIIIVALGLVLIHDRNYFFWPPDWAVYFNSYWVEGIGIFGGSIMTVYGLFDIHNNWIAGFMLAVSAAFTGALLTAELLPVIGISFYHWHVGTFLLLYLLLEIMKIAWLRDPSPRHKRK